MPLPLVEVEVEMEVEVVIRTIHTLVDPVTASLVVLALLASLGEVLLALLVHLTMAQPTLALIRSSHQADRYGDLPRTLTRSSSAVRMTVRTTRHGALRSTTFSSKIRPTGQRIPPAQSTRSVREQMVRLSPISKTTSLPVVISTTCSERPRQFFGTSRVSTASTMKKPRLSRITVS